MKKIAGLALILLLTAVPVVAKDWPLNIAKGQSVVLKIPRKFWQRDKFDAVGGKPIYHVMIEEVLAQPSWQTADFPYMAEFRLEKVFHYRPFGPERYTDVELRTPAIYVKLRFPPKDADLNKKFGEVVAPGVVADFERSDYFLKVVFPAIAPRIFVGPLAKLPEETKLGLLHSVNYDIVALGSEVFKNNTYLVVDLGEDINVYNTLQLNQTRRVAKVLNERLLLMLKNFAQVLGAQKDFMGVKIQLRIPYKNFLHKDEIPATDLLQLYSATELIGKFAEADVTNQQLIDGSIVLVNSNRVQVSLSGS